MTNLLLCLICCRTAKTTKLLQVLKKGAVRGVPVEVRRDESTSPLQIATAPRTSPVLDMSVTDKRYDPDVTPRELQTLRGSSHARDTRGSRQVQPQVTQPGISKPRSPIAHGQLRPLPRPNRNRLSKRTADVLNHNSAAANQFVWNPLAEVVSSNNSYPLEKGLHELGQSVVGRDG